MSEKALDEIFCRSCGEIIKEEAEICPECGVRNKQASSSSSTEKTVGHDPTQYETNVTDTWWYGVVAGIGLWVIILFATSGEPTGTLELILGLVVLVAWAIMPVAAYFDMQYVRANSTWNPNTVLWVIGMLVWLVNIIAGAVYLYRRHETVGEP
jgi:hypothetical protein